MPGKGSLLTHLLAGAGDPLEINVATWTYMWQQYLPTWAFGEVPWLSLVSGLSSASYTAPLHSCTDISLCLWAHLKVYERINDRPQPINVGHFSLRWSKRCRHNSPLCKPANVGWKMGWTKMHTGSLAQLMAGSCHPLWVTAAGQAGKSSLEVQTGGVPAMVVKATKQILAKENRATAAASCSLLAREMERWLDFLLLKNNRPMVIITSTNLWLDQAKGVF